MKVWNSWLEELDQSHGKETVDFWLRSLVIEKFDARNLYLRAKDSFQVEWFEEQLGQLCSQRLKTESGAPIKVHFVLPSDGAKAADPTLTAKKNIATASSNSLLSEARKGNEESKSPIEKGYFKRDSLDPQAQFSTLIEHSGNRLPLRALNTLAQDPVRLLQEPSYNPIYICGAKGCGKTHLLMALTHRLHEFGLNALYTSIPTFTHNVVQAIRKGYMSQFRQMHRQADVLIFDDVDLLAGKSATQEEFFHTFNTMHTSYKQVVLSSSLAPSSLKDIQPRLVSRFEWGLVAGFQLPKKEDLLEIASCYYKSQAKGATLDTKSLTYLIQEVGDNPCDITKAIDQLILADQSTKSARNWDQLEEKNCIEQFRKKVSSVIAKQKKITPEQVLYCVSDYFGITTKDLLGKSQQRDIAKARHIALFICRKLLQMPYTKIGQIFSRDHSTVMTGYKKIEKKITENEVSAVADFEAIKTRLQAR